MNDTEDILESSDDAPAAQRNPWYTALVISWTAQNAIALAMFFYSLYAIDAFSTSPVGAGSFIIQFLAARGLPLAALGLLWLKKRSGWWFTIICAVSAVLKMMSTVWQMGRRFQQVPESEVLSWMAFLIIFLLSALSLWMGLSHGVRQSFTFARRQQVWAVLAGIVFTIITSQVINIILAIISSRSAAPGVSQ